MLKEMEKNEIMSFILSENNAMKLEINGNRNHRNYVKTWKVNNTLLDNQ